MGWNASGEQFFFSESAYRNVSNAIDAKLSFSHTGSKLYALIEPSVGLGRVASGGTSISDYVSAAGAAYLTWRFVPAFELSGEAHVEKLFSRQYGQTYANCGVNLRLSWLFGDQKRSRLSVYVADIFNDLGAEFNRVTDNYVSQSYSSLLGRSAGLSFHYNFSRR